MHHALVGILLSAAGSFATATGFVLEKHAHNENQKRVVEKRVPTYKMPLWWLGFFFDLVIAGAFTAISLSLADQMILAPLSGLTLVFNAVLSSLFLHEKMSSAKIWATCWIVLGTTVTTVSGLYDSEGGDLQFLTLSELKKLASQPSGLWFLAVFNSVIVFLLIFLHFDPHVQDPQFIDNPNTIVYPIYVPLCFSTVAGMAAAQQQLALKSISELASSTTPHNTTPPFQTPYPYLIFLFGLCMGIAQVAFVNEGMKRFHNTLFIPVYNAGFITFNILSGMLFFNEISTFSNTAILLFVCGACLALAGQLQLLWGESGGKEVMIEAVTHRRVSITHNDDSILREMRSRSKSVGGHEHSTPAGPVLKLNVRTNNVNRHSHNPLPKAHNVLGKIEESPYDVLQEDDDAAPTLETNTKPKNVV